jgi:hypothetical protein
MGAGNNLTILYVNDDLYAWTSGRTNHPNVTFHHF